METKDEIKEEMEEKLVCEEQQIDANTPIQ